MQPGRILRKVSGKFAVLALDERAGFIHGMENLTNPALPSFSWGSKDAEPEFGLFLVF